MDRGFRREQSVLTKFTLRNSHVGNYGREDLDQLREMAQAMAYFEYPLGMVALLSPARARTLAEQGMSKDDVRRLLWESARRPIGELRTGWGFGEWWSRTTHRNTEPILTSKGSTSTPWTISG